MFGVPPEPVDEHTLACAIWQSDTDPWDCTGVDVFDDDRRDPDHQLQALRDRRAPATHTH